MTKEKKLFTDIGEGMGDAELGQMFSTTCLKVNGKAFACIFQKEMVFKPSREHHEKTLAFAGAQL